jgi:hypothetical protein
MTDPQPDLFGNHKQVFLAIINKVVAGGIERVFSNVVSNLDENVSDDEAMRVLKLGLQRWRKVQERAVALVMSGELDKP